MNTRKATLFYAACLGVLLATPVLQASDVSTKELIGGLKSSDESVRLQAISQLGAQGEKAADAVGPLTESLKDESAKVRAHALWALGEIGAPAKPAIPAIAQLLKDPDETVRRQVVKAVRAINPGPKVMIPLCVKLLEDADAGVRVRVLSAISDAGAQAVPGLIEALDNEQATYWACVLLRDLGPAAKDAVPSLVKKLKDPRPEIRREAVLALGAMDKAAIPAIPQIVAALSDEHARMAATFVLGQLAQMPADAEATVRQNAKSDDVLLRTVSLWALARVHPEDKELLRQTMTYLVERLKDSDPFVRVTAAQGLLALPRDPEIAMPIWEKALENADEATMRHALDALASLGAPAVPRLIEALKHEKARVEAIYILGRIGPPAAPATKALAALLNDKNDRVVHESALALANIGPGAKEAVPALVKILEQEHDPDLNFAAVAYALGKIGPDAASAEPSLLRQLGSSNRQAAMLSAWALVQIRPDSSEIAAKAVPVLAEGLAVPLPAGRKTAAEALGKLGPSAKAALPSLQKAAKDEDQGVRDAVAQALKAIGQ